MEFFADLDRQVSTPTAASNPDPTPQRGRRVLLERLQTGWRFRQVLYADRSSIHGSLDEVELAFDGHRYIWIERTRTPAGTRLAEVCRHLGRTSLLDWLHQRPDVAQAATAAALRS